MVLVQPELIGSPAALCVGSGADFEPSLGVQLSLGDLDYRVAWFRNEDGQIRQSLARILRQQNALDLNLRTDQDLICAAYSEWVLDDVGIVLKKTIDRLRLDGRATFSGERERLVEYQYVKASKRGNDVDAWHIDTKMKGLEDAILPYCQSTEPDRPLKDTRAVKVTLTVDPRLTEMDLETAWLSMGRMFNDFKSRLAKTFGTVLCEVEQDELGRDRVVSRAAPCKTYQVRSWEAHESGWPHAHAVMCFEDFHFKMFKDEKDVWRIKYKDRFQDAWPYGFVDVQALTPGTLDNGIQDVLWYVSKNLTSMDYRLVRSWARKRLLTQAILWYYGLRSFSVSRSLLEGDTEPDLDDLTKRLSVIQNDLLGDARVLELVKWEFVGLVRRKHTELTREDWAKTYSDPPDWVDRCWKPHKACGGLGWASSWGGA